MNRSNSNWILRDCNTGLCAVLTLTHTSVPHEKQVTTNNVVKGGGSRRPLLSAGGDFSSPCRAGGGRLVARSQPPASLVLAVLDLCQALGVDDALLGVHLDRRLREAREEGLDTCERIGVIVGRGGGRALQARRELGRGLGIDNALVKLPRAVGCTGQAVVGCTGWVGCSQP